MASQWRQRQKETLRKQLYQAATELFERLGYENTTVQQITEHVGVAKGTFFNHYPSKEHVVAEWYNGITFNSLARARKRGLEDAEQAALCLFTDMAKQATAAPELLIAKSRNSADPLLLEAEKTQDEEVDAFICQQCDEAKARGDLSPDLDVPFFVDLLGAVLTGSSRAWVRDPGGFDFPQVIEDRVRFLFRAVRPTGR